MTARNQSAQTDKNEIDNCGIGHERLNMESEVKLEGERGADPVMIASGKKKVNTGPWNWSVLNTHGT